MENLSDPATYLRPDGALSALPAVLIPSTLLIILNLYLTKVAGVLE